MAFDLFISFIILLRIAELFLSRHNEKWLLQNGAVEYGKKHYPLIVIMHTLFFVSLIAEHAMQKASTYNLLLIILYFILLCFKVWVIISLGKYWNTKIYHIQNVRLINNGPYKYFKHPNYMVVVLEIAIIPLAFHLYYTAVIFTILNAVVLYVRIKEEDQALKI